MTRARQELVPNIPWEVDDVEIEGTWAETWSGDYFLLHQDNEWGPALFFPTSPVDNVSSYSIILVFKTLVYQSFPSKAT
jgi:hypothetical protein